MAGTSLPVPRPRGKARRAHEVIDRIMSGKTTDTQRGAIMKRLGLTAWSPRGIVDAMKRNPLTTGLVALELYDVSSEVITSLVDEYPEIEQILPIPEETRLGDTSSAAGILEYRDEFADIQTAIAYFGNEQRFRAVRRALAMSDETLAMHAKFRSMARGLRL